jgi:hypothetical protein
VILRKLAEAIRRQDWFTVVLEILIVVVGLFLGLQLDGWNQVRKDRTKEHVYLERLSVDIERDAGLLARSIEAAEGRARDAVLAMDGLADAAVVASDPCRFLASISRASSNFYPVLYRHTFGEIVSNGHLELIRSNELKDELSQYYTVHESGGQWMDSMRQINVGYVMAFAGILSRDERKVIAVFENGGECLIDVDRAMAARERVLAREGLAYWLPTLEVRQESLAGRLQRLFVTNERLRALLAHELD